MLSTLLRDSPFCELPQKGIHTGNEDDDDENEHHSDHPNDFLGSCRSRTGLLIFTITETALDDAAGDVGLCSLPVRSAVNLAELLLQGLLLLIIVAGSVFEHPMFGSTEKAEIESHNNSFFKVKLQI